MKMKIQTISVITILLLAATQLFATKIESCYIEMPDILNPVVNKQQRMELLEYFKANMGDSIENRFGKQTHILKMDTLNNYIQIQNTDISTFEMKLLENSKDTIIGIIKTVCTPICQSTIVFYNMNWEKREDITFNYPETTSWIDAERVKNFGYNEKYIRHILSTDFISLSFIPSNDEIIVRNNTLEFLDEKDRTDLEPFVKKVDFVYQYKDNKWTKK